MPRMGKTEEDWSGLKLGFLKTVQPSNFSKLIPAACNFKNNTRETFVCLGSLILSFTCNFFAYFKFHSDWGWVIGKINQNELDCRDTAPLIHPTRACSIALIRWALKIVDKEHAQSKSVCCKVGHSRQVIFIVLISSNLKRIIFKRTINKIPVNVHFRELRGRKCTEELPPTNKNLHYLRPGKQGSFILGQSLVI